MKTIKLLPALFIGLSVLFTSCNKDDNASATIVIEKPSENDTLAHSQELHIEGTITGTGELRAYSVTVTNTDNGTVLLSKYYDNHSESYNFHEHWTNNVDQLTHVRVRIDVTENKKDDHEIRDVNVVCLP